MTNFEMVEKLREKANVSYEEAKSALELTDWDLLDAMVLLEQNGKVSFDSDSSYSTRKSEPKRGPEVNARKGRGFSDVLSKIGRCLASLIKKGNENSFEVYRRGEKLFELPVTALFLLMLFNFWWTVPIAIVGLFFGFTYSLKGPGQGRDTINDAFGKASEMADELKRDFHKGEAPESGEAGEGEGR